jgi:hypothetical protein
MILAECVTFGAAKAGIGAAVDHDGQDDVAGSVRVHSITDVRRECSSRSLLD